MDTWTTSREDGGLLLSGIEENVAWTKFPKELKFELARLKKEYIYIVSAVDGHAIGVLTQGAAAFGGLPMTDREGKAVVQAPRNDWVMYATKDAYDKALTAWKAHEAGEKARAVQEEAARKTLAKQQEKERKLEEALSRHGDEQAERCPERTGQCISCYNGQKAVSDKLGGHLGRRPNVECLRCNQNTFLAWTGRVICDACASQLNRCNLCHIVLKG